MKLLKINILILLIFPLIVQSQKMSDNTIGLRLGDSDGIGASISYQKSINQSNRIEANLGFRDSRYYNSFKLSTVYQWVKDLDGDFNWYYGFGGGLGNVNFEDIPSNNTPNGVEKVDGGLFVFAAANLGVEYSFDFPITLSLDMRPEIGLLGYSGFSDNFDFDIGLGIRYQF